MQSESNRAGRPLTAEEFHAQQQEDEQLGRMIWASSTRTGSNLSAPTTADLRALGAQAGAELLGMADASMRAAASAATLGLADEFSAGAGALFGGGGEGGVAERYGRLHSREQATDEYNRRFRPKATALGELGMATLIFRGAANAGAKAVSRLPPKIKGKVGERMSDGRTLLSGDIPVRHGKRLNLRGGGHTFTDHQTVRGKIVEAKLGPTARLTGPQRRAQAEFGPRYRYDHWSFDDVGRVIGGAVAGAQQGLGRISDEIQETPNRPERH